jgi:hypothetical protein
LFFHHYISLSLCLVLTYPTLSDNLSLSLSLAKTLSLPLDLTQNVFFDSICVSLIRGAKLLCAAQGLSNLIEQFMAQAESNPIISALLARYKVSPAKVRLREDP